MYSSTHFKRERGHLKTTVSWVSNFSSFPPPTLFAGFHSEVNSILNFVFIIILIFFVVWAHLCISMQHIAFSYMFLNFIEMNAVFVYLRVTSFAPALWFVSSPSLHRPEIHSFYWWSPIIYTFCIPTRFLIAFCHGPLPILFPYFRSNTSLFIFFPFCSHTN